MIKAKSGITAAADSGKVQGTWNRILKIIIALAIVTVVQFKWGPISNNNNTKALKSSSPVNYD